MPFTSLRVQDICFTIRFSTNQKHFESVNKKEHIIGIQLEGDSVLHTFADRSFALKKNMIYFFNKDEDYVVDGDKGLSFSVHFTTVEPIPTKSFCLPVRDNTKILNILTKIEYEFNKKNQTTPESLSELYKLFALFGDIYRGKYLPKNQKLEEAKEYINLHFKEKDCLKTAAEIYGVSRRRFGDVFAESFHITPNQYINSRKIEHAKNLISSGQLSVGEVAEYCGFSDLFYFSKIFKKETGQTPTDYKNGSNKKPRA